MGKRIFNQKSYKAAVIILTVVSVFIFTLISLTFMAMRPLPQGNLVPASDMPQQRYKLVDRNMIPLSMTYEDRWNITDRVQLYKVPELLRQAFISAEDKRFNQHHGVDWNARAHALIQNIRNMRAVRGASTITEQVVRMLHPRPRTVWSRWIEGFEAAELERKFSKSEILEFYLNQVPYASNRTGIVQAARHYFSRDIDTLSPREMLTLATLVRSPSRFDLYKSKDKISPAVTRLADRMLEQCLVSHHIYEDILSDAIHPTKPNLTVRADHFIRHVLNSDNLRPNLGLIETTLDSGLQRRVQQILEQRIKKLKDRKVSDGAVLIADLSKGHILSWVNAGARGRMTEESQGSHIDMITTPRQPGSTLKPLLYAMALDSGWTAATIIDDSPLSKAVGTGLHEFHNYSRKNYGHLRLRDVLGNSLNIPAIKTIKAMGTERFLDLLHSMNFMSLDKPSTHYGEGLALGNGEVTLLELVSAYATLARGGIYRPLITTPQSPKEAGKSIFSAYTSQIMGHILSDPEARRLEFGSGNLLRFPLQTAVKTGTSSDYRDAWTVGYSSRYVVGVWLGNSDLSSMQNITGSVGPAVIVRSIFNELDRHEDSKPLYMSSNIVQLSICRKTGLLQTPDCPSQDEYFAPGTEPTKPCTVHSKTTIVSTESKETISIKQPSPGLRLARDPRIPDELERFEFILDGVHIEGRHLIKVQWIVDDRMVGTSEDMNGSYKWKLTPGAHTVYAKIYTNSSTLYKETKQTRFYVR